MKDDDFSTWLDKHICAYPGLSAWLANHPAQISIWRDTLSGVSVDAAIEATRLMARGNIPQPHGWTNHARAVRGVAADISRDSPQDRRDWHYDVEPAQSDESKKTMQELIKATRLGISRNAAARKHAEA